jgi:hypothetical protein
MTTTTPDTHPLSKDHPTTAGSPITIDHVRDLLAELEWFYTRDWHNIIKDPKVAQAVLRRSTRAALCCEDIRTDILQALRQPTAPDEPLGRDSRPPVAEASVDVLTSPLAPSEEDEPPRVTTIPISVDRVELFDFGTPHEHEHPLYKEHNVMHFCAAFYHEDEFIFARAHLQLLLTPTGALNWLAGSRSVPIDRNYLPLPYVPGGELFNMLGLGITQLIYTHQTELKMRMKQGYRFPADYKLTGMVIPGNFEPGMAPTPKTSERQKPAWINDRS